MRVEANGAREACRYDPFIPDGDVVTSDDANLIASDSWYEDAYPYEDDV